MALVIPSVSYPPKQRATGPRLLALLLVILPIIVVGVVVMTYAVNLPYWDDFLVQDHLLLLKSGSGRQKLMHLFDQHWEHRIIWTRLVFAFFVKINGSLNYYGLTLIGTSGLLVVLGILFAVFRRIAYPLLYFVPIPFLLFTLQSYENLIWAMASIQNFWLPAFALGTFYWLSQNTPLTRWLALGVAVFATFSGGNGSLLLIAGLIVLVYQRQWRFLAMWFIITVLALVGYFYSYHRITFFPSPFRYPASAWIKAFFVFLGAFGDASPNAGNSPLGVDLTLWITVIIGASVVALMSVFLLSAYQRFRWAQPDQLSSFLLGFFLFLLATAAITVYSRVGFAGPGYMLQGRYRVYSALSLSVVYLFGLYQWRSKPVLSRSVAVFLVITIGQSLFSDYLCLEGIINQRRRVVAEYFNFLANTPAKRQQALQAVFVPTEPPLFSDQVALLSTTAWLSVPATTAVDNLTEQPFMYNIPKADAVNPSLTQPDAGSYIFLKSGSSTYLFAARPLRPSSTVSGFTPYFTTNGVYAHVLKEKLAPGHYRIGVLTNQNNHIRLAMTDRSITFTSL